MITNETIAAMLQQFQGQLPFVGFFVISLVLVVILVSLLIFVGWIWMIVDCAKRNRFRTGDRVMWTLLLVLTGLIGMILYYFMEIRKK
jgi:hypothetical protein